MLTYLIKCISITEEIESDSIMSIKIQNNELKLLNSY